MSVLINPYIFSVIGGISPPSLISSRVTASLTVAYPVTGVVENNVAIIFLQGQNVSAGSYPATQTATPPAGWTQFTAPIDAYWEAALINARMYCFWKRLDGTETGSETIVLSAGFEKYHAAMFIYDGCITTGDPIEDPQIQTTSGQSSTPGGAAITTTVDNCLAVNYIGITDDSSAVISTPGVGWTEDLEDFNLTGNDTVLYAYSKVIEEAGAVPGHDPSNIAVGEAWGSVQFALKPNI